jgi:hypothetical protein
MQKLATIFGFVLMASLIMLSTIAAAIPMGNMNLFSDAMALGKHFDKDYKYQEDEKNYYYSDEDNRYSPDYNYYEYYQPMQQEQQSGYNNNNYGYDNDYKDKRISYNTSYEDTKNYSTYPTKDKKYICQKGQFEGFYVDSVEFCKLKGPPGPQGPSGIVTLNDTSTYIVSTLFPQVNASSDESVVAICDPEDSIINGGYETDTDPNNRFQIRSDVQFPFPPTTNMWFVNIQNIGDNPLLFIVYATCFDNPPTHIP